MAMSEVKSELKSVVRLLEASVRLALAVGMPQRTILVALRKVRHTAMGVKGAWRGGP